MKNHIDIENANAAASVAMAVEYLMVAQRALLRGHGLEAKEVAQYLLWAQVKIGEVSKVS